MFDLELQLTQDSLSTNNSILLSFPKTQVPLTLLILLKIK